MFQSGNQMVEKLVPYIGLAAFLTILAAQCNRKHTQEYRLTLHGLKANITRYDGNHYTLCWAMTLQLFLLAQRKLV